jgi:hypothetical protein
MQASSDSHPRFTDTTWAGDLLAVNVPAMTFGGLA